MERTDIGVQILVSHAEGETWNSQARSPLVQLSSPQIRKPFDMLAEGLLVSSSQDDKTAVELFVTRVRH